MVLTGFLLGYVKGAMHSADFMMEKFAPAKVASMTGDDKRDYEKSLGWAHKVLPFLMSQAESSNLNSAVTAFYGAIATCLSVCLMRCCFRQLPWLEMRPVSNNWPQHGNLEQKPTARSESEGSSSTINPKAGCSHKGPTAHRIVISIPTPPARGCL